MLDAMVIDAGVEAEVNDENREVPSDDEVQEVDRTDDENELAIDTSSGWWKRVSRKVFTASLRYSPSHIAGVGTVALVTEVNGLQVAVVLDDVFYVPGADHGLLSPGLAAEQGFKFDYDRDTMNFRVM
ncbi:unnamed protein product [Phytophthora fragariaefolia]|uniref:Unnamed protein product n=1 Tax=Phytophthora fragariaefolia TaxID=1490495 RepID=A0A9W6XZQ6_9STRA|nr:unnamed protein product [Phytophthora fragariaefolia]